MNTTILASILAYVMLQFAIGTWVSRRITSDVDYIVAGRKLGTGLVAFSVFATWFGAEAIQVSAGEIYEKGLAGALVDPFGYGLAVLLVGEERNKRRPLRTVCQTSPRRRAVLGMGSRRNCGSSDPARNVFVTTNGPPNNPHASYSPPPGLCANWDVIDSLRHRGRMNVGFADGHCENVVISESELAKISLNKGFQAN